MLLPRIFLMIFSKLCYELKLYHNMCIISYNFHFTALKTLILYEEISCNFDIKKLPYFFKLGFLKLKYFCTR